MKIRDVLRSKGDEVVQIAPDATVRDAVVRLAEHHIGSLVVTRDGEIWGMLTERDILNLVARDPESVDEVPVSEIMTTDVIVAVPTDDLDYAMNIMTNNRIRHLPIVAEGGLAGLVSIGDLVNQVRRQVEAENRHLKDYIQGRGP